MKGLELVEKKKVNAFKDGLKILFGMINYFLKTRKLKFV